jgi:hypothetical protein
MSACSSHNSCSFAACPTHLLLAAASCCRPVLWLPSKTSITCIAAVHQPAFLPREKRGCITTHWQVCHRGCSLCQGLTSYKPPPPCARHPPMAPFYLIRQANLSHAGVPPLTSWFIIKGGRGGTQLKHLHPPFSIPHSSARHALSRSHLSCARPVFRMQVLLRSSASL